MRTLLRAQFVRYVAVGVVNTGFSYGVYALGVYAGLPYALANVVSAVLGTVFSFVTQGRLVFGQRDNRRFGRFVLTWAVLLGFNLLLISLFVRAGLNAYQAGAVAIVPVTLASYLLQRSFVFRAEAPAGPGAGGDPA